MNKLRFRCALLFLLSMCVIAYAFSGIGSLSPTSKGTLSGKLPERVHVISIGIDRYRDSTLPSFEGCAYDAKRIVQRVKNEISLIDSLQKDTISVIPHVLIGNNATLPYVEAAFDSIVRSAQVDDIVVFYFAGLSLESSDGHIFKLYDSIIKDTTAGLTMKRFKHILNNIRAARQLIILDAGNTKQFGVEFLLATAETDPLLSTLRNRDRVIICPYGFGREMRDPVTDQAEGELTTILCSQPDSLSITTNFFKDFNNYDLELSMIKTQLAIVPEQTARYVNVLYERDYQSLLQQIAKRQSLMRGVEMDENSTVPIPSAPTQHYRALLIGTDSYEGKPDWGDLRNPVYDVHTVARVLAASYGFDTTLLINATRAEILKQFIKLQRTQFDSTDYLLIYISGHGYYEDHPMNMGYLVCHDSKPRADDDIFDTYISYNQLDTYLDGIPCKHILLVLDACFGGTFDRHLRESLHKGVEDDGMYRGRSKEEIVTSKATISTRLYIASGGKEYVPDGRPGENSPFTRRFLEALQSAGNENKFVSMNVLKSYLEKVTPEPCAGEFGHNEFGSDFIFVAK